MKRILGLIFFITYIFLLYGQTENVGNLYLKIFDKNGEIKDKLKIELFSSSGETYCTNERYFFNIPLNQHYAISISSKNYYDYHQMIFLSKNEQTDTVVLKIMIKKYWFMISSKTNKLTISTKKVIKKYIEECSFKSSNLILTINIGNYQPEDFETTIAYIFNEWTKYNIRNKNSNTNNFSLNFDNNPSSVVTYYIEMKDEGY